MPSDIEILRRMIVDKAKVTIQQQEYNKPSVVLTEPQCPNASVKISNLPSDIIIINLDDFWSLDSMFQDEKGQRKRADFVIIVGGDLKAIIYIELKRGKERERKIIQQLTGAQCFVSYCQKIGKAEAFWNQHHFLDEFKHRFVSISRIGISKKKTRIRPTSGDHDVPDRMLKLSSPGYLTIKRLIEN